MKWILKVATFFLQGFYNLLKLFPTKNKITMISRQSNSETMDFKLLREEIEAEGNYQVVVLTKKLEPGLGKKIKYMFHMIRQMYHIATSKVVILDTYCIVISILKHKKNLLVIQMWHAMGCLKKFGYSVLKSDTTTSAFDKKLTVEEKQSLSETMKMHRGYDYIFASSEASAPHFAEAFGYGLDSMVIMPLPVVDLLLDKQYIQKKAEEIKTEYPSLKKKKTIVYVPTFRPEEQEDKIQELIDCIDYRHYNLVVKVHPLTKLKKKDERVIWDRQFSSRDMMMVADFIISDYSAILYEAVLLKKPIYFYAYDYEEYSKTRSFYTDYQKEMPGLISASAKEIFSWIQQDKKDISKIDDFIKKYINLTDEKVCRRITSFIDEAIKKRNS